MLRDQLAQEVLVEPMEVLDRVEHGEAGTDAKEQRDLAEAGLQVDDDRRPLRQPRQLHRGVHRHGGRAGAAFGAEEDVRDARLLAAGGRRFAPRRHPAHGAVERFLHRARGLGLTTGHPREELVGAGAHRLKNQVGLGGRGDGEDGNAVVAGAQPLDGGHTRTTRRRGYRRQTRRARLLDPPLDDCHRNAAGSQQPSDLSFELFVVADD